MLVKNRFNMYFVPYIKTTSVCYGTEHSECWYQKTGCGDATISFTLPNGSSVCMDDYEQTIFSVFGVNTTLSYIYIIDTNGKKLPNKMGEDLFIAVFNTDKASLVPSGDDMSEEEVKKNCSLSGNRYWCLSLMKRNGWKIPRIK